MQSKSTTRKPNLSYQTPITNIILHTLVSNGAQTNNRSSTFTTTFNKGYQKPGPRPRPMLVPVSTTKTHTPLLIYFARNTLHIVFNLNNAADVIDDQSNTILRQLVHNTSTSSYVLHLLLLNKQFYQQNHTNRHLKNSPDNEKTAQISWCTKPARRNHPIGHCFKIGLKTEQNLIKQSLKIELNGDYS